MKYLTYEEMEKLTTKRLLAYKRKYLQSEDILRSSFEDYTFDCTCPSCIDKKAKCAEHDLAYKNIKEILSKREHVQ